MLLNAGRCNLHRHCVKTPIWGPSSFAVRQCQSHSIRVLQGPSKLCCCWLANFSFLAPNTDSNRSGCCQQFRLRVCALSQTLCQLESGVHQLTLAIPPDSRATLLARAPTWKITLCQKVGQLKLALFASVSKRRGKIVGGLTLKATFATTNLHLNKCLRARFISRESALSHSITLTHPLCTSEPRCKQPQRCTVKSWRVAHGAVMFNRQYRLARQ